MPLFIITTAWFPVVNYGQDLIQYRKRGTVRKVLFGTVQHRLISRKERQPHVGAREPEINAQMHYRSIIASFFPLII